MDGHGHGVADATVVGVLLGPFVVSAAAYAVGAGQERRRGRDWPLWRTALWMLGLTAAASGFVGPLADAAHRSFSGHATAHVVVGMLAPLLLVAAAPVTLALRCLAITPARRLSRLLRSAPVRAIGHPVTAAALSVGSLWLLHRTALYELLATDTIGHAAMMLHFLAAGLLFTAAIAPADPSPHRAAFRTRAIVLLAAAAAHGILSKLIYVDASATDVRLGAQVMFYGGDAVDLALMLLLCAQWYRASGRELTRARPLLRSAT